MFTRKDYLDGKVSHHDYYSQFLTNSLIEYVKERFKDKIYLSEDDNFNNIALTYWDQLYIKDKIKLNLWIEANGNRKEYSWSACDRVCIAKAAAKIIKDSINV